MQIHVVMPGQSLYGIGQAYGVTVDTIAQANKILPSDALVVGQALVIPIAGSYYWVQPGDSLFTIARRTGTTPGTLAAVNRIPPGAPLPIGLRLYIPTPPRRNAEVNAYVEPRGDAVSDALLQASREAAPNLTFLAPFSFRIQRDASLKAPPLNGLEAIAGQNGVTLMMVVTNLENDQFSAELGETILNSPELSDKLLDNIVETARQLGFRDIHFDIEHLRPADREAYNVFLRKASARLHREGLLMSTALVPKTSASQTGEWYTAHDYKVHGETADFVIIMTYEWGYSGGPPMAVSPIDQVKRVLQYALTEIPAQKIMMGQNLYGYDWTLPFVPGGAYARAISPQEAIRLAREHKVSILYDYTAQAPHFLYRARDGQSHEVWFEDARSIMAKFNLIKELGLRGISYWKLGLPFPQNWLLLPDQFIVVKR